MKYWKYKAFDTNFEIVEGLIAANSPFVAMVKLRNRNLQVYSITTANNDDIAKLADIDGRLNKLTRLRNKLLNNKPKLEPIKRPSRLRPYLVIAIIILLCYILGQFIR